MQKGYVDARTVAYKRLVTVLVLLAIIVAFPTVFFLADGPEKIKAEFNKQIEDVTAANFFEDAVENVNYAVAGFQNEEGKVNVSTEGFIENIIDISELQASKYSYSAICKVMSEDGTTPKYYIAYEGEVTLGIDLSKVTIDYGNSQNKVITITIPEVEIQKEIIDAGTLEYIFVDNKYNNEKVPMEAHKKCEDDLHKKAISDEKIFELAYSNVEAEVRAFTSPLVEQFYPDYTLQIQKEASK